MASSSSSMEEQVAELTRQLKGQKQLMDRALATQSKALLAEKVRPFWTWNPE